MSLDWENGIYGQGKHLNRYPFDSVVRFVYRNAPGDKPRSQTRILEVGCGAGNNLWFAAREGFCVSGIDSSASAIEYARCRFQEEGLAGDLRVGELEQLPFPSQMFDLVIDRAALTYLGYAAADCAVSEIHRVLEPRGKFHCDVYSDRHTSAQSGAKCADGRISNMTAGALAGTPDVSFRGRESFLELFATGWRVLSIEHVEISSEGDIQAQWRAILERH